MRFGVWNVRSLNRVGSFTAAARDLAWYKLDFVCVCVFRNLFNNMLHYTVTLHVSVFLLWVR
jgi:hypothetical protein